uniref:Uncharacterized protein n=1 Tax=Populus trichocarpa TaxID=3694 RepID=A0A2K1YH90_POPTR
MTIREVKDLTKLPLKELIDSLMTHEITMEKQELDKKPNKNLTFKTMHHVDSDDDDDDDDENFLRKKQGNKKFLNFKMDENKEESSKVAFRSYKWHLEATSATRRDTLRSIAFSFKTRRRTIIINKQ